MSYFVSLVALFVLIALPIGLIKPSIFKMPSRKRVVLVFCIIFFSLIIIYAAINPQPIERSIPSSTSSQTNTVASPKPPSLEDQVKSQVKNVVATHLAYQGLDIQKADPDRTAGTKSVTVRVDVSSFWDHDALIENTGTLSSQLFQTLFQSDTPVADAFVWYYGDTHDRYGNIKHDVILVYAMDKATYQKINWDNFSSSGLCNFLKTEEKIVGLGEGPACNELANLGS